MTRLARIPRSVGPTLARKMTEPLLSVTGLRAWYGDSQVVHGIDLDIASGETVTLLGRNGAGKSTTLKAITGALATREGRIRMQGKDISDIPLHHVARHGIAYVPENRGIFASLNVRENLILPPVWSEGGYSLEDLYALFPNLQERLESKGTNLSGGEQQMLAIARVLRTGPKLLLLDEPAEGLAPVIVQRIGQIIRQLKERGISVLLVEQNFRFASRLADRHYIMENGCIVDCLTADDMKRKADRVRQQLGL
jgi:branched-chain amino acid transport system ATP-binding protein